MRRYHVHIFCCYLLMSATRAFAGVGWDIIARAGIYQPTAGTMKEFFGGCCSVTGSLGVGLVVRKQYAASLNTGFFLRKGPMIGSSSGTASQDTFSLLIIPTDLDLQYRFEYRDEQLFVPYLASGFDVAYFHESDAGVPLNGVKSGLHGGAGVMIRLNHLLTDNSPGENGLDDVFFVTDLRYKWLNNFGGAGLNLSGYLATAGIMATF